MPPFRGVEFPDLVHLGRVVRVTGDTNGSIRLEARDAGGRHAAQDFLTPEQQDELWRRLGEARGHLPPATTKPKPWRDLAGGEG